ncbi:D-hexose-6-phosphate mutarotase [Marinobacterium rhizophilum]|uniref:Putative glucose-6-phosphate 1-epimerase n=1 Tax=Marinobacterium rhizophilum TaxID=420402 RepID=A0ABY5HKK1_9GAMM|nr:D-hexose-6-phosphate mutarotase [Marinobacterium rhizophilum]UTW12916.1 D-hexose-6-phosphate mutarotase [Marinobacterium rhizophilum]
MNKELMALLQAMPDGIQDASLNGFSLLLLRQPWGELVLSRQGAQVLHFRPAGRQPLLWLSDCVQPAPAPIRGGIPLCWPWFAAHPQDPSRPFHGLARTALWDIEVKSCDSRGASLVLQPEATLGTGLVPSVTVEVIDQALQVSIATLNATDAPILLSQALHSYLAVSDVNQVVLDGLDGCEYRDKLQDGALCRQQGPLLIRQATDRIYRHDTVTRVQDTGAQRCLGIGKFGSGSTVVWNPGAAAESIADVGMAQQPAFVCVEAANTFVDPVQLLPGQQYRMGTLISILE